MGERIRALTAAMFQPRAGELTRRMINEAETETQQPANAPELAELLDLQDHPAVREMIAKFEAIDPLAYWQAARQAEADRGDPDPQLVEAIDRRIDACGVTSQATAEPEVIMCPDWCERGDEHCGSDDVDHWTNTREVSGGMTADVLVEGGRPQFQLHASDHVTLSFMADDVARLISVLSGLLAEVAESYQKRVVLPE